ncbi:MAG: hypothetical protein HY718_03300 [Planctomycetes bacterium]|nr:hypothetical protein [Planctomycetota bacterium]
MSEIVDTAESAPVPPLPEPARPPAAVDLSPLFILMSIGLLVGIVLERPKIWYTVNDASRWNTIYYLVQHGTYEFLPLSREQLPKWANRPSPAKDPDPADPGNVPVLWTIDMIRVDGKLCSPKPPLLPTVLAGVAWITQKVSGCTFQDNPRVIVRTILIVAQVIPLAIGLVLLRRHVFRITESPFARNFAMAAAAFGTYLTPWSVTLNNHVIAACTGMIAVDAFVRIWYDERREWYWFALAAFFAAFTAATELPAGLLMVVVLAGLLIRDRRRTLGVGLIAAAVPIAAALYTNYLVTGGIKPAYMSKNVKGGFYDYPGSYWNDPQGIDNIKEPKSVYLGNLVIGHDGFFSLTPILLVSLLGIGSQIGRPGDRRLLAAVTLAMTAIVIAVYVVKTSDYGGGCQGYRWLFWLLPLWLLFLPVGAEWMDRVGGRVILYWLLAISIFSVGYALDNPWTNSWLRTLFNQAGWIDY